MTREEAVKLVFALLRATREANSHAEYINAFTTIVNALTTKETAPHD